MLARELPGPFLDNEDFAQLKCVPSPCDIDMSRFDEIQASSQPVIRPGTGIITTNQAVTRNAATAGGTNSDAGAGFFTQEDYLSQENDESFPENNATNAAIDQNWYSANLPLFKAISAIAEAKPSLAQVASQELGRVYGRLHELALAGMGQESAAGMGQATAGGGSRMVSSNIIALTQKTMPPHYHARIVSP